mgnify:CR=1 FL=1
MTNGPLLLNWLPVWRHVRLQCWFSLRAAMKAGFMFRATIKGQCQSIMGMMTLDLPVGEQVVVTADGADEEKAINDIEKYLSNN